MDLDRPSRPTTLKIALGQLMETADFAGTPTNYSYDANGATAAYTYNNAK